jgi:hypothetical protein
MENKNMKAENAVLVSVACGFIVTCAGMLTTNLSMFAVGVGMTIVGIAMLGFVKNVSK